MRVATANRSLQIPRAEFGAEVLSKHGWARGVLKCRIPRSKLNIEGWARELLFLKPAGFRVRLIPNSPVLAILPKYIEHHVGA